MLTIQPTQKDKSKPINKTAHIPPLLLFLANFITPTNQPIKKVAKAISKTTQPLPRVRGFNAAARNILAKISINIIYNFSNFIPYTSIGKCYMLKLSI